MESNVENLNGAERIARERARQIEEEGFAAEHDDQHENGELAQAAACYAIPPHCSNAPSWPLSSPYKKHLLSRLRQLEISGAFAAAEIDRLLRLVRRESRESREN